MTDRQEIPVEGTIAAVLVEAWAKVTGRPADGATDLFDLGGDSLTALQIIEFATTQLGLSRRAQEFLLPEIFVSRTPDACATVLAAYLKQETA